MRTKLLKVGLATTPWIALSQTPAVTHNTWSSAAPLPTAVYSPAVAVLAGQIYVVGGVDASNTLRADTQIYNPVTNSWSTGVPLPTPVYSASAAVVNNVLYVIGGNTVLGQAAPTDAVWAYHPKTKTWSSKTAIPGARYDASAVVENNIIYVVDGNNGSRVLYDVESYNPATNAWTMEAPLNDSVGLNFAAGLMGNRLTGFTIVVAGADLSVKSTQAPKLTTPPRMRGHPSRPIRQRGLELFAGCASLTLQCAW